MVNMAAYLAVKTADYTLVELTLSPHKLMPEEGLKQQYIHEYDDGKLECVTTSESFFIVTIQWDWLSDFDAVNLLDFYHKSTRANGKARTFYWPHPVDGNTYVARFASDLTQIDTFRKPNAKEVPPIILRIEGVKA